MRSFQEIIHEKDLLALLNIKKEMLYRLRKQGFPCVALSKTHRVYLVESVLGWLENRIDKRVETP